MKKIIFASLLLGSLFGASLAQAQAVVSGAVVINDRHSRAGIYYQQAPVYAPAPVYYGRPAPVYYAQPVYAPRYYPQHGWHHHEHRYHHDNHYRHGGHGGRDHHRH